MTIRELIEELKKYDPEWSVSVHGFSEGDDIEVIEIPDFKEVVIREIGI